MELRQEQCREGLVAAGDGSGTLLSPCSTGSMSVDGQGGACCLPGEAGLNKCIISKLGS